MAKKVLLFDSANEPRVFLGQGIRRMRESGTGYFVLPERHAWMWMHHFKLYAIVQGPRRPIAKSGEENRK